jgi:hypothetical protein
MQDLMENLMRKHRKPEQMQELMEKVQPRTHPKRIRKPGQEATSTQGSTRALQRTKSAVSTTVAGLKYPQGFRRRFY